MSPALRYHGAKFRLAPWILKHFPPHRTYVEPFGGAAGVLLHKPKSYAEVYNDLDGDIVNFWRVLRAPETRQLLIDACELTPFARSEFDLSWEPTSDPIERARRTAVRAMMGFGSAGATKGSTGFRIDTKRLYGTAQDTWVKYPEAIAAAGRRFEKVIIENRPALDIISQHDGPNTLHFLDPPYVHSTRCMRSLSGYKHEMSDRDHIQLLQALNSLDGMVVISGYESDLYAEHLPDWTLRTTRARISSNRGTAIRKECVWLNRACVDALDRSLGSLFTAIPNHH